MAFKLRGLFAVLALFSYPGIVQAAPPVLNIQPENYSYDLSVTGLLIDNCDELKNPDNMLIAYVKGEVRGFVKSSTLVGGRYMAFLTVYSNQPSSDTITFQIYSSDKDKLLSVKTKLIFQDDAVFGSPSAPLEIITNNRPANLALSTLIIPEHASSNPDLAIVSATDADLDNILTYSIVAGIGSLDNKSFKISGNKLQFNGKINTLVQDTFKIRLRAEDNFSCSVEKEFSLIVDRVNDAPTGLDLSDSSFFENTQTPTIGRFSGTDQDRGDKFKYSLVSGTGDNDNASFSLLDSSLVFNTSANFEVKNKYSVRCRVADLGGLFFEKVFKLYVKDNNDNPTNIVLSNSKVFENEPKNQLVAKLSTIDEDAIDKYVYTFANVGTNDNNIFIISNDSLKANLIFDFETKSQYFIYLTSTDSSGLFVTKPYTITIKDTFDIPTNIFLGNNTVAENSARKSFVGKLTTEDANLPKPSKYLYTLVPGAGSNDNSVFQISNDSLYSDTVFDFERKQDYKVRVKTTLPNGMSIEIPFSIKIIDVNETPTLITLTKDSIPENTIDSVVVCFLSTTDQEGGSNFKYSLVSGQNDVDNQAFGIYKNGLYLLKSANFEKKEAYKIRLRTTDVGGAFLELPFTIVVKDVNEKPVIKVESYQIPELSPPFTSLGFVTAKDVDRNQILKYKILSPEM
ncbi:MAG: cadherin repeat domain-containing protein, partial [Opitutaceae bacterium]|nr:cadherin repeat domain-containing protein [Cytophagales bacterium]